MSTLTEKQGTHYTELQEAHAQEVEGLRRRSRIATIVAMVLGFAVLGLGAYVVADAMSSSDLAASSEIEQLVDDYHAAWNDQDAEAFDSLTTDGYRHRNPVEEVDKSEQMDAFERLEGYDWHVEMVGEPMMIQSGSWYYVAVGNHITYFEDSEAEGFSVLTILDDDGILKVHRHTYVGQM